MVQSFRRQWLEVGVFMFQFHYHVFDDGMFLTLNSQVVSLAEAIHLIIFHITNIVNFLQSYSWVYVQHGY